MTFYNPIGIPSMWPRNPMMSSFGGLRGLGGFPMAMGRAMGPMNAMMFGRGGALRPQNRGSAFLNPNFLPPNSALMNPMFGFGYQRGSMDPNFIAGTTPKLPKPAPKPAPRPETTPEIQAIGRRNFEKSVIDVLNNLRDRGK